MRARASGGSDTLDVMRTPTRVAATAPRIVSLLSLFGALSIGCGNSSSSGPSHIDIDGGDFDGAGDSTVDAKPDSTIDTAPETKPDSGVVDADANEADAPLPTRLPPTNGSAITLNHLDDVLVVLDRDSTTKPVAVFDVPDFSAGIPKLPVAHYVDSSGTGVQYEPWQTVIDPVGDDAAYVTFRATQEVVKIAPLHKVTTALTIAKRVTVGSEPTGIAVSPNGTYVYSANWAEGTVSMIQTSDMTVVNTINLNEALWGTGVLGISTFRLGLAHPRAIVVTNNGDKSDADETVLVTEYYSQALTGTIPTDDSQFDLDRQGMIYAFNAVTPTKVSVVTLAPIVDTGFEESAGAAKVTGCFPNQLAAAAINNGRLYVTATCTSPKGPIGFDSTAPITDRNDNFRAMMHAALFVVDLKTLKEIPKEDLVLTREFKKLYDSFGSLNEIDPRRRMPLMPVDLSFVTGTHAAYVAAEGSDALFRVEFKDDGSLLAVGATAAPFVQLDAVPGGLDPAHTPIGVATPNHTLGADPYIFVDSLSSRNVSIASSTVQAVVAVTPLETEATGITQEGKRLFISGLDRWSFAGQAWQSCASCHPDGLSDGITWFFPRGPRQTPALAGVYDPTGAKRKLLSWTASMDQVHDLESLVRHVSGGVGAYVVLHSSPPKPTDRLLFEESVPYADGGVPQQQMDGGIPDTPDADVGPPRVVVPPQNMLNGSTTDILPGGAIRPQSIDDAWSKIDAYVQSIRPPRAPNGLSAADVTAGHDLFVAGFCAACHGGSQWTLSNVFYTPGAANNDASSDFSGNLRTTKYTAPTTFPPILNPPTKSSTRQAFVRFFSGFSVPSDVARDVGLNDRINCILRDVGTFPVAGTAGIAPSAVVVKEVRADMTTVAQGVEGFNPPSLLGLASSAPYFHAGNARTLEEVFDKLFDRHTQAHASAFLGEPDPIKRAAMVKQLVAFLLSIDASTTPIPVPSATTLGYDVDLCAQVPSPFP